MVLIDFPNALNIFLTKRCNLKCRYCFVDKDGSRDEGLDIDSLKRVVSLFLAFPGKNKTISFSGGEPLLEFGKIKKLYPYIQRQNDKNTKLAVTLTTNGTILSETRYKFLKDNQIGLRVSIDGQKEIHDYNRPFKQKKYASSFDSVMRNLTNIRRHDKNDVHGIRAQLVFTPTTIKKLFTNIKFLLEEGFGYIDFCPDLYAQWSEKELDSFEIEFNRFVKFYISLFRNNSTRDAVFENNILHSFVKEAQLYKPVICQKVHLDCKGNFYCCDKVLSLPEDMRSKFAIGSVKKGIDNSLRLRLIKQKREEIKKLTGKDCRKCEYVKYCFCPVGQYIYFSSRGLDFKQYFLCFCRLSKIYIKSFLEIKNNLRFHPLFTEIYNS